MKKGGPAPAAAKGQKHEHVGVSTSTQPKTSEPSLTKAEIGTIVEKSVSEALARQISEFQAEITKSTKQQVHDVSNRLLELGDKSLDANAKNVKRFQEVEDNLSDLNQRCGLLEKLVERLDGIVEEKVRLILRKIHPDSEVEEKKWSEQLARSESVHQEEIQKLHQQHHQDMLSVINDCCRKLKSSFTRQNKPYDVGEVHIIIDDIEQKMIREILSEIEKTDTHEDLSSFEVKAPARSELSHEVGPGRDFNRMSSDEIAASLNAFEVDNLGSFSQDLENAADAVAAADAEREPVVEENISASRSMITGDRGNTYYMEELKRTVDGMIALGGSTGENPIETEAAPELPPKTRSQQEVEDSLESLIITGVADNRFEADIDSLISKDMEKKDKAAAVEDPKLGGQSKTDEIWSESTNLDPDRLKSLQDMVEGDFSWADIQPPAETQPTSKVEPKESKESKSCETVIQPATTTSAKTQKDQDQLKSLEVKGDFSWTDIQPSSKIEPKEAKSREAVIQPATTTSAKTPKDQDRMKSAEGKVAAGRVEIDQGAESAQDLDQMKALEAMLEAQMTDSPDTAGRNLSQEHSDPTSSAKQKAKANVSEQVTSSALQTTETIKKTTRTGFDENPHYVEEVLSAAASTAKDKP